MCVFVSVERAASHALTASAVLPVGQDIQIKEMMTILTWPRLTDVYMHVCLCAYVHICVFLTEVFK